MPDDQDIFTVRQVARHIGASDSTVRNWSREFADYLSELANPAPGQPRQFTAADVATLATVAVMRQQLVGVEDIRAALDRGERLEPVRPPEPEDAGGEEPARPSAPVENALTLYVTRVTALEASLQELNDRLLTAEKEHAQQLVEAERRIAAERERAAGIERELEILRSMAANDQGRKVTVWELVKQALGR